MTQRPHLELSMEAVPRPEDIAAVNAGLSAFNRTRVQVDARDEYQMINIFARADDGTVMGGLLGATFWGWLFVDILWVHDDLRGLNVGTDLMRMAEDEALQRGCHSAYVDTHSFQALPFYQRLGYEIACELEDFPPGHSKYFLKKRLASSATTDA